MRLRMLLILTVIALPGSAVRAQDAPLPTYTDGQRWQRLAELNVSWQAAIIALGKAKGMNAEEVGRWLGEFYAPSWLGGAEASQLMRGFYRNFMSMPRATGEVVNSTATSVTARFNRPVDGVIGPTGRTLGVSVAQFDSMYAAINRAIADWTGVDLEQRVDGDHDVFTFTTLYGPVRAGGDIRWARGSYLSWLSGLQLLSVRMASGMSAREVGEADAKLYGPGWTARTPWQLYRGMVWNWMSDPATQCDVMSASPDEVRARCREHYRALVVQNQEQFKVTPEDVFESGRAFAAGVADQLGMRWTETLENGYRMITVTKK